LTDAEPVQAEPVRRTSEIEELSNLYLIHPISAFLTPRFAALGIKPNAVSLAGMAFGIAAGFCYFHVGHRAFAVAGFLLMIAWHVMDGADGQLARLTGTQSELGKILDGICDYVTFIAVYTGLGIALAMQHGVWVVALVALSGLCHAVQSAAYEAQRQAYNAWGMGRMSARVPAAGAVSARGATGILYGLYTRMQRLVAGVPAGFDEKLAAAHEAQPEILQAKYRRVFAASVRRWSVMSSNYRTLGIFICAVLNVPLFYFWLEIIGLSPALILLLAAQRQRATSFL
jgi:phosphatidylglycerophosphate synthase